MEKKLAIEFEKSEVERSYPTVIEQDSKRKIGNFTISGKKTFPFKNSTGLPSKLKAVSTTMQSLFYK